MKLDQKYFIPFMGIGAIITMIFIVYASFEFKLEQEENFRDNVNHSESLTTDFHPYVLSDDSISLSELVGDKLIILFWASWSDRSADLMADIDLFASNENYKVVGAVVKDATETAELIMPNHDFIFIDGTKMYNDLKVPGIPSYFVLDEEGKFLHSFVGYKKGYVEQLRELFEHD